MKRFGVFLAVAALSLMGPAGCSPKASAPELSPPAAEAAGASGGVLFEDDFRSARRWLESSEPPCQAVYTEKGLLIRNIAASGTCEENLLAAGQFPAHVRIEASLRKVEGPSDRDYGLKFGFGAEPGAPYFTFTVKGDGSFALAWYGGIWKTLLPWQMAPNARPPPEGAVRHLAAEVRGRQIRVFLDGREQGKARAAGNVAGYVGFYLDAPGLAVEFTHLRVASIE